MNRKVQLLKYLTSDFLTSLTSWSLFYVYRINSISREILIAENLEVFKNQYLHGLFFVPLVWLFIYSISGYYKEVFRKSRLAELWQTFGNTLIGTLLLYFAFNLGNEHFAYDTRMFLPFISLFIIHFLLTYIPRAIITTWANHKVHRGEIGFNTLLIGSGSNAREILTEIKGQKRSSGNKIVGYVEASDNPDPLLREVLRNLGGMNDLLQIISDNHIEEVIIALEPEEHSQVDHMISTLLGTGVEIKAIPSMYDILTGSVRMNSILATPLISISNSLMPAWQENMKEFLDYLVSFLALIITLPLSMFLVIGIKLDSRGPVFYSHERIGRHGKPFKIFKFRSMYPDSEKNGPDLSSRTDDRITNFGRFMRKSRIDEIPNFLNVLRGEMSLVGPRPERRHFINQIVKIAPHYMYLLKVKPGITSWGQVKYGYAENVDQMVQRMKYDLLYLENMSLFVDFKIIIYTILTIIKRKGI